MAARQQLSRRLTTSELEPFIVANVRPTGRELGAGAYGSVVEVEIPGASVAAKKLHDGLVQFGSEQQVRKWISDFVDECKLMSLLRHPHIVQFLGVCYLQGSRLPVLLMEKLPTSLDDLLEKHKEIPLDVKYSILVDVSRGLVYLHCRDPAIAHRDLTARNILLDLGLTAKIADLGVARMVNLRPGQVAATMTRAPGNIIYMPPEAVEEEGAARYNTAIDMFSFGNVALFTLTQVFMKNLKAPNYRDPTTQKLVARSEIERREEYVQLMYRDLSERHPVVRLVLQCLEYDQVDRPSAVEVLQRLEEAGNIIPQNCRETKLELIHRITGVQREKEVAIQELRGQYERQLQSQLIEKQAEIGHLQEEKEELCSQYGKRLFEKQGQMNRLHISVSEKQEQIQRLETERQNQLQQLQTQRADIETKNTEITLLHRRNENQRAEVNQLSGRLKSLELQGRRPQPLEEGVDQRDEVVPVAKPRKKLPPQTRIPTSILFNWRRCKDIPHGMELCDQPLVLNGKVFVRTIGPNVCTYMSDRDVLDELPSPPVESMCDFTIAILNDQLVLVGGRNKSTRKASNTITVWDSQTRQWVQPYPPMATAQSSPAAVGYGEYLIVAGGYKSESERVQVLDVNILDTTSRKWVTAESLPSTNPFYYRSVLIEDILYLLGDDPRVVLRAHIPTLISQATSATPTSSQSVWESLPNAPFYHSSPVAVDNALLAVGGFYTSADVFDCNPTTSIQLYNPANKQWTRVGDLPEAVFDCKCAVLSGELFVLGGWDEYNFVHSAYAAKLSVQY